MLSSKNVLSIRSVFLLLNTRIRRRRCRVFCTSTEKAARTMMMMKETCKLRERHTRERRKNEVKKISRLKGKRYIFGYTSTHRRESARERTFSWSNARDFERRGGFAVRRRINGRQQQQNQREIVYVSIESIVYAHTFHRISHIVPSPWKQLVFPCIDGNFQSMHGTEKI